MRKKAKEWKKRNEKKLRKYNREYYFKNKERIMAYRRKNKKRISKQNKALKKKYKERFLKGGWETDEINVSYIDKKGYLRVGKHCPIGRHIINWARTNGRLPEKGKQIHHIDGKLIYDKNFKVWTKNDDLSNLEERPHDGNDHDKAYITKLERENEKLRLKLSVKKNVR